MCFVVFLLSLPAEVFTYLLSLSLLAIVHESPKYLFFELVHPFLTVMSVTMFVVVILLYVCNMLCPTILSSGKSASMSSA